MPQITTATHRPMSVNLLAQFEDLLDLVGLELQAQHDEWDVQNYPLISDAFVPSARGLRRNAELMADDLKATNDWSAKNGNLDWSGILLEEAYEALAEEVPGKAIVELIQVAAVAINAAASIQRNGLGGAQ